MIYHTKYNSHERNRGRSLSVIMDDVENQYNEAIAKAQEAFEELKENGGGDLKDQIEDLR